MNDDNNQATQPTTEYSRVERVVTRESGERFRLDKAISVGLVITILTYGLAGAWYASAANSELADHERRITENRASITAFQSSIIQNQMTINQTLGQISERIARLEVQVTMIPKENAK